MDVDFLRLVRLLHGWISGSYKFNKWHATIPAVSVLNRELPKDISSQALDFAISTSSSVKSPSGPMITIALDPLEYRFCKANLGSIQCAINFDW